MYPIIRHAFILLSWHCFEVIRTVFITVQRTESGGYFTFRSICHRIQPNSSVITNFIQTTGFVKQCDTDISRHGFFIVICQIVYHYILWVSGENLAVFNRNATFTIRSVIITKSKLLAWSIFSYNRKPERFQRSCDRRFIIQVISIVQIAIIAFAYCKMLCQRNLKRRFKIHIIVNGDTVFHISDRRVVGCVSNVQP